MNITDGLWRQRLICFCTCQIIIESLNHQRREFTELNSAYSRNNMVLTYFAVTVGCVGFNISQIFCLPDIKKLCNCQFARLHIAAGVNFPCLFFDFLRHFFLCLARKGFLDLLSCSKIISNRTAAFPIGVFTPIADNSLFPDCSHTISISVISLVRHNLPPFKAAQGVSSKDNTPKPSQKSTKRNHIIREKILN